MRRVRSAMFRLDVTLASKLTPRVWEEELQRILQSAARIGKEHTRSIPAAEPKEGTGAN